MSATEPVKALTAREQARLVAYKHRQMVSRGEPVDSTPEGFADVVSDVWEPLVRVLTSGLELFDRSSFATTPPLRTEGLVHHREAVVKMIHQRREVIRLAKEALGDMEPADVRAFIAHQEWVDDDGA